MNISGFYSLAALLALASLAPASAFADDITVSYSASGVQAPSTTTYYDTFDSGAGTYPSSGSYSTNFGGSAITGTYSGTFNIVEADEYGGAGGSGDYLQVTGGNSAIITLSTSVNYFGLWFSALDPYNELTFYNVPNGGTANSADEVLDYTPADFIAAVGPCPSNTNSYCGNPNGGGDPNEQFAYLNFLDNNGTFNTVMISEGGAAQGNNNDSDFEADNLAVEVSGTNTGTPLGATPEPSSLALLGTGITAVAGILRRRKR